MQRGDQFAVRRWLGYARFIGDQVAALQGVQAAAQFAGSVEDRFPAKKTVDGRELFIIGPFTNKPDAENIIKLLEGVGAAGLSLEEIKKTI